MSTQKMEQLTPGLRLYTCPDCARRFYMEEKSTWAVRNVSHYCRRKLVAA